MFDAEKVKNEIVGWIKEYFDKNGKDCNAIVGISGGKDSSIVATLCVEALGKNRVYGVLMPQGEQHDIDMSFKLVNHLGINKTLINIKGLVNDLSNLVEVNIKLTEQASYNIPARLRMTILYAISASMNGRVANTSNLSEDWIGWVTKYGDSAGDFSPLSNLTVTEILQIGKHLNLPQELISKVPEDGLTGKTDEENFGFSYKELDNYIRHGVRRNDEFKEKVDQLYKYNRHKLKPMPSYKYEKP